jgi:regulator of replication initiation timing
MADIHLLIQNIKQKAERIVEKNKHLTIENTELKEKFTQLQRSIDIQRETIKDLEEKNKMLKIANSLATDDEGKKALKQKINSVIREIDKSMSLLND